MVDTAVQLARPHALGGHDDEYVRPGPDATAHIWLELRAEVAAAAEAEPMLSRFFDDMVLSHERFEDALAHALVTRIADTNLPTGRLREVIAAVYTSDPDIVHAGLLDVLAVRERDPASDSFAETLLYFKGFHALQAYRVAHWLWVNGRIQLALYLQSRTSQVLAVDIHPAARIGTGILIDHATSVVIGETAVVDDNVSILHEVTLGGTGKEHGDRHPKVGRGVLIGAGAKLLGNVKIGIGARIGAGSVVLDDVCPHCTFAGVPAVNVGPNDVDEPALEMDHSLPHSAR